MAHYLSTFRAIDIYMVPSELSSHRPPTGTRRPGSVSGVVPGGGLRDLTLHEGTMLLGYR
jgi:hypothetical protein